MSRLVLSGNYNSFSLNSIDTLGEETVIFATYPDEEDSEEAEDSVVPVGKDRKSSADRIRLVSLDDELVESSIDALTGYGLVVGQESDNMVATGNVYEILSDAHVSLLEYTNELLIQHKVVERIGPALEMVISMNSPKVYDKKGNQIIKRIPSDYIRKVMQIYSSIKAGDKKLGNYFPGAPDIIVTPLTFFLMSTGYNSCFSNDPYLAERHGGILLPTLTFTK